MTRMNSTWVGFEPRNISMTVAICVLLTLAVASLPCHASETESTLQRARQLQSPPPAKTLKAQMDAIRFWEENSELLRDAWRDWEDPSWMRLNTTELLFDETQRTAVDQAWKDPDHYEQKVKDLWKPVAPGVDVFTSQLLNATEIPQLRQLIALSKTSGIPMRRQNDANRHGIIIDPDTDGAIHMSSLQDFGRTLVDRYVRPIGRLLFPEYISAMQQHNNPVDDLEWYIFTVQYNPDENRVLQEHSDASLLTLNINLNLPGEENDIVDYGDNPQIHFSSNVDDHQDDLYHPQANFSFSKPGVAVIHRGMKRHQAYPIVSGQRVQLIVWMFGKNGFVRAVPYGHQAMRMTPRQRWSVPPPAVAQDDDPQPESSFPFSRPTV